MLKKSKTILPGQIKDHERMARGKYMVDSLIRLFLYVLCVIGISAFLGRCATTRGAGTERAETINQKIDTIETKSENLKSAIEHSNATSDEKKKELEILDSLAQDAKSLKPAVSQLGKDEDHEHKQADSNAAAAHDWHVLMWFLGIGGILSLVMLWVFRGSIISKLFGKVQS